MHDISIKPEMKMYDLAMLYNAADLVKEGLILPRRRACSVVFGMEHALPGAEHNILDSRSQSWPSFLPENAAWTAAGIGPHQFESRRTRR